MTDSDESPKRMRPYLRVVSVLPYDCRHHSGERVSRVRVEREEAVPSQPEESEAIESQQVDAESIKP